MLSIQSCHRLIPRTNHPLYSTTIYNNIYRTQYNKQYLYKIRNSACTASCIHHSTKPHHTLSATPSIHTRVQQSHHTYIDINSYYRIIKICGNESFKFLQGLCSNDMRLLTDTHNTTNKSTSIYTVFLNSKGRILFDSFITQSIHPSNMSNTVPTYYIEVNKDNVANALNHFKIFNLRNKLSIELCDNISLYSIICNDSTQYNNVLNNVINNTPDIISAYMDPRFTDNGIRVLISNTTVQQLPDSTTAPSVLYNTYRYINGIPYSTTELQYNKSLPLECNIDLLHGVSYNKGCYLGQELTNRTQSHGIIRKRLYPVLLYNYEKYNDKIQLIRDKLYGKQLNSIQSSDTQAQYLLYDALTPIKQSLDVYDIPIYSINRIDSTQTIIRGCTLLSSNNKIAFALLRNEYVINNTKYDLIVTLNNNDKYYVVPYIPQYMTSLITSTSDNTDTSQQINNDV